ncbi:MAG: hypothetical protein IJ237_08780 [Oscillospiraceae bacterium]|nr:hypothetical protein [Oscillospiraceae bacterium]
MRRLIRADLRRILAKPGFYICPLISFALFIYGLFSSSIEYDSYYSNLDIQLAYIYPFLVLLPIFTCVYGDELRSGTMITAIGRGLSRTKVILAKFIDTVLLSLAFVLFFLLMDQITFDRFSVVLTKVQILRVFSAYAAAWLQILGFCTFAAIFVYLTWNSSVGLVAGLISIAFSKMILDWLQNRTHLPFYDVTFLGQADMARRQFDAGNMWMHHVFFVLLWYALFLTVSALIFNRKELDL